MKLTCGKCLCFMNQLKSDDLSLDRNFITHKASYKCLECGNIVLVSWKTKVELKLKKSGNQI